MNTYHTHGPTPQDIELQKQARKAGRSSEDNSKRLDKLESNLEKLSLISEALWAMVKEDRGFTDEQLMKEVDEIVALRKERSEVKSRCTKCRMENASTKLSCIYCGNEIAQSVQDSPFSQ